VPLKGFWSKGILQVPHDMNRITEVMVFVDLVLLRKLH
jgi:hypothetical protein